MADPFDDIDVGQDFEDFAVGLEPVTVSSIHPVTGAVLATAEDVPAAKLFENIGSASARGGEVGVNRCEWWFRCDRLGFVPKPRDLVTQGDGTEWILDGGDEGGTTGVRGRQLAKFKATKKR